MIKCNQKECKFNTSDGCCSCNENIELIKNNVMFGKDSLSCKNYKEKSPAGDRAPSKVNENSQHYSTMIQEKYQPTKEQVREGLLSLIDNALSFMCSLQDWVAKDNVWFNDILILREAIRVLDEQEERSK